jgi:hypothetical protein
VVFRSPPIEIGGYNMIDVVPIYSVGNGQVQNLYYVSHPAPRNRNNQNQSPVTQLQNCFLKSRFGKRQE